VHHFQCLMVPVELAAMKFVFQFIVIAQDQDLQNNNKINILHVEIQIVYIPFLTCNFLNHFQCHIFML